VTLAAGGAIATTGSVEEGGAGARRHLDVLAAVHIETPAGLIELSGRGSSLVIDLQKPSTLRELWRPVWAARHLIPRLAHLLEFAGLEVELRVGSRRIASIGGGQPISMPARLLGLHGCIIYPRALLRSLVA